MNRLKTTLLLSLLTVMMVMMGSAIGGKTGMVFAFIMAAAMNFFSYWFSDKIVLRMYGAQEIGEQDHPTFYGMVADWHSGPDCLCQKSTSSPTKAPMPLPLAAIRSMQLLLPQRESCAYLIRTQERINMKPVLVWDIPTRLYHWLLGSRKPDSIRACVCRP